MNILIVEDEKRLADALSQILLEQKYIVDVVYDGIDGLEYAESGIYDCIILDIMLPSMNGFEVCLELRRKKITTPVLMLTAKDTISDKVRGLDAGADDYMTKPIDLDELFLRIGALLRRSKIASSHRIELSDFVMDADERTAVLHGEEISLTAREFDLLYKLLSYPKKTFTRTQLMDEFWDVDTQAGTRTVDVYMTKLRAKLSGSSSFEIQTVHGLGYKAVIK